MLLVCYYDYGLYKHEVYRTCHEFLTHVYHLRPFGFLELFSDCAKQLYHCALGLVNSAVYEILGLLTFVFFHVQYIENIIIVILHENILKCPKQYYEVTWCDHSTHSHHVTCIYMPLLYAGDMEPICNSNLLARIVIKFHSNEL